MTRKFYLIAGVAALAISAPASADRGDREARAQAGKSEQRKAQNVQRQGADRPQRAERPQRVERAQRVERPQRVKRQRRERADAGFAAIRALLEA